MQERYLVEHTGQPLALFFPTEIHTPYRIVQRLCTHLYLCRKALLRKMLYRTAHLEVFRKVVFPVESEHSLSLLTIVGITLKRNIYGCTCIYDTLIENRNLTCRIVNGIVTTLHQFLTSSSNFNRTLRHIICTQRNHIGCTSLELTLKYILILLGYLLCHSLRRIVQLSIDILTCLY